MSDRIIELALIKLAEGKTEHELIKASETFQEQFLSGQNGFVRRDLVRKEDGTYMDIILWESRAHADAIFEKAQKSEAVGMYFSLMDFDPENMAEGVEHCGLLTSFPAG